MIDYECHGRKTESTQDAEVLREVALKRVEAGHRRVRAYAIAWGKLLQDRAASSRMSCYRVLQSISIDFSRISIMRTSKTYFIGMILSRCNR